MRGPLQIFLGLCATLLITALSANSETTTDQQVWPGGRLSPDTLIRNFSVPGFNPEGFRQWQLTGAEGIFVDDAVVQINQLQLRFYSADEANTLQSVLRSPEALVEANRSRALSDAPIQLEGPGFRVEGEGWVWQGQQQTILIRSQVAVTFQQSLRYIIE